MFTLGYGDGSFLVGRQWYDTVSLGGYQAPKVRFGSIAAESPGFAERKFAVDGIMGLGYTALDSNNGDSVFEVIARDTSCPNSFGMCLGLSGGVLSLGGSNPKYSAAPMRYTAETGKKGFYEVEIANMQVGGADLFSNHALYQANRTIVDSGTTLLMLPDFVLHAAVERLRSVCKHKFSKANQNLCYPDSNGVSMFTGGACVHLQTSDIEGFPDLSFFFKPVDGGSPIEVTIPPKKYFLQLEGVGWCFGLQSDRGRFGGILGDIFMQTVNTEFDRKNARIGFAPVQNCEGASPQVAKGDGDSQQGAVGHELAKPLAVSVKFNVQGQSVPAGGLVVVWSADQDISFGQANSSASVVDPTTGSTNITIIPKVVGKTTITATVMGTTESVTFTVEAAALIWWEILIIVGSIVILLVLGALVGWFIMRRRARRRSGGYVPLNLNADTGDGLLSGLLRADDNSEDDSTELITASEVLSPTGTLKSDDSGPEEE
jgi:Eukaryotic aspartyl protease